MNKKLTALLLSAVHMLRHINENAAASRIMSALGRVLLDGATRTRDLGGRASTSEFSDAICRAI
jgi:isocitrate dehydrogenase (NAD+)